MKLPLLLLLANVAGAQTAKPTPKPDTSKWNIVPDCSKVKATDNMCWDNSKAKPPTPAPKADNGNLFACDITHPCPTSVSLITFSGDPHCGWLGNWDEDRKVCAVHVSFTGITTEKVTCSPVTADGHMVCWYKPTEPEGAAR